MKKHLVIAGAAMTLASTGALAQGGGMSSPACQPGSTIGGFPDQTKAAQDACQQAYDLYQFMSPQLGLALAGGNATIGQGGVLGGLGHFSIGIRGNVFNGSLPQVDQFSQSINGARQSNLPTQDQILGLPTADAAVGLFKGIPLGLTNVGGLDLLASATYVPKVDQDDFSISPDRSLQLGWGARVGLLSESLVVPGVSVTWIQRDLPTTTMQGSASDATLSIKNLSVKTTAWRVVASKSLVLFGVAAGVGQDSYDQSAEISATITDPACATSGGSCTSAIPNTSQKLTRTNAFVDLSLNLPIFKLVAEVGQASGGKVDTYNSFSGTRADRAQTYGSLGFRLSW
jgi:hypothetical protein